MANKATNRRTAKHVLKSGDYRLTIFDDGTTRKDRIAPGKIISINKTEAARQTNENGIDYWLATVEADFNGVKQVGPAIIWDAQLTTTKLPADTFAPGANISIAIQASGEYAGNASIELPDLVRKDIKDFATPESLKSNGSIFKSGVNENEEEFSYKNNYPVDESTDAQEKKKEEGSLFPAYIIIALIILLMWFVPVFIISGGNLVKGLNAIGSNILGLLAFVVIVAIVIGIFNMGRDSNR